MGRPTVLLVGERLNQYSHLAQRLASWGGECRFTDSHTVARVLLGHQAFELVIGELHSMEGSAPRMIPLPEGES